MFKWKDIKDTINFNDDTKILVFNEDSSYSDVTQEIVSGWNKTTYDNYLVLNIFMHLNTITLEAY